MKTAPTCVASSPPNPTTPGRKKTELAARNARRANPNIKLTVIEQRIETPQAREALTTWDWIFLAADTHAARHWTNQTIHQYLIPATQVGVKIPVNGQGDIGQIHTVTRLFLPGDGCMWCNGLINPTQLAIDMLPDEQRDAARYIPEVAAPSVITLNGTAVMEALNHFLLATAGLHTTDDSTSTVLHLPQNQERLLQQHRQQAGCPYCTTTGTFATGCASTTNESLQHVQTNFVKESESTSMQPDSTKEVVTTQNVLLYGSSVQEKVRITSVRSAVSLHCHRCQ